MNFYIILESYKRDVFFNYDCDVNSLDKSMFERGLFIDDNIEKIVFLIDKIDEYLIKYDILPTMGGPILVSSKFKNILEENTSNSCQFFRSEIHSVNNNDINNDFFALNIIKAINCIDTEKSIIQPLLASLPNGPKTIKSLFFDENKIKDENLFRLNEDKNIVVFGEDLAKISLLNLKGIEFICQGDMKKPIFLTI